MKQEIYITEHEKIVLYLGDKKKIGIYTKDDYGDDTMVDLSKRQLIHLKTAIDAMIDLIE